MLLLDNSAWGRLLQGVVSADRGKAISEALEAGEVAVCLPFLLEAGYSARSGADRASLMARLAQLPKIDIDRDVESLALEAQRELAEIGHHRLAPSDVVIAACAHSAEAGVLHYDGDYDIIARHTSLVFESTWLAPAGTL